MSLLANMDALTSFTPAPVNNRDVLGADIAVGQSYKVILLRYILPVIGKYRKFSAYG